MSSSPWSPSITSAMEMKDGEFRADIRHTRQNIEYLIVDFQVDTIVDSDEEALQLARFDGDSKFITKCRNVENVQQGREQQVKQ